MQEHCCNLIHQLAEEFTIAARLHYEAVVNLASTYGKSPNLHQLIENVGMARQRVEQITTAFIEHIQSHYHNEKERAAEAG